MINNCFINFRIAFFCFTWHSQHIKVHPFQHEWDEWTKKRRKHKIGENFFTRNSTSSSCECTFIFHISYMYDDDVMHKFMQNYDVLHVETNGWKKCRTVDGNRNQQKNEHKNTKFRDECVEECNLNSHAECWFLEERFFGSK